VSARDQREITWDLSETLQTPASLADNFYVSVTYANDLGGIFLINPLW
jgi:hypothetical protein